MCRPAVQILKSLPPVQFRVQGSCFLWRGRTTTTDVKSRMALLILAFIALALFHAPKRTLGDGVQIPIVAYVSNARPEVLSLNILDENRQQVGSVDPAVPFFIEVVVRDNNTLADLERIEITVFSPESSAHAGDVETDHYTVSWQRSSGFLGEALVPSKCDSPDDLSEASGRWVFCLELSETARASDRWVVRTSVEDEADEASSTTYIEVNAFAQIGIAGGAVQLSGPPGGQVSSPVNLSYATNYVLDLGAWATPFVGKESPEYTLGPENFVIDDDPSTSPPEEGIDLVRLSSTRRPVVSGIRGRGSLVLYVFVDIPEPFMDQDYEGRLVIDVRAG